MVDRYFWGEIERISPEAPVPVVEIQDETYNLGGAANVVNNLVSLGAEPVPFGVIGNDQAGKTLKGILKQQSLDNSCVFIADDRPTTVKTRVIARNQHIVRIDRESREDLPVELQNKIIDSFATQVNSFDAAVFQDYNKGVITERVLKEIIQSSKGAEVIISADPKFHNFFAYKGVTLFKPNIKETEAALITKIRTDEDVENSGRQIIDKLNPKYLIITRGSKGMTVFLDHHKVVHLPTRALRVHDVSGAGDTVIATLMTFLSAGATIEEAATIANYAAAAVCEEVGVVSIDKNRLKSILLSRDGLL